VLTLQGREYWTVPAVIWVLPQDVPELVEQVHAAKRARLSPNMLAAATPATLLSPAASNHAGHSAQCLASALCTVSGVVAPKQGELAFPGIPQLLGALEAVALGVIQDDCSKEGGEVLL
jgi:hypothetical protein